MNAFCAYGFSIIGAFWVLLFGVFTQKDVARYSISYRILLILVISMLWPVSVPFVVHMSNKLQKERDISRRLH